MINTRRTTILHALLVYLRKEDFFLTEAYSVVTLALTNVFSKMLLL